MYTPKAKFDLPNDAPKWAGDITSQIRDELLAISRTAIGKSTTVVIAGTDSTPGTNGSISSISPSAGIAKAGTQIVTAGTPAWVPFPITFTSIPKVTLCFIAGFDTSFGSINASALTVSTTGFSIPGAEIMVSGTIFYIAVSN
jgi:hypothetical protein